MSKVSQPLYQQLMTSILGKIESGEYAVGQKIASEREMASRYNLNRLTVRRAIGELVREGYLVSVQGKGTFVRRGSDAKNKKRVSMGEHEDISLSAVLRQSGFSSSRKVLSFKQVEARDDVADHFGQGTFCYELIRLSSIDGEPYALQICYFPQALFSNPERFDFADGSLYTYMEIQGHLPDRIISNMWASPVPQPYLEVLNIEPGRLLFYYEYESYDASNELVEFTRAYYRSEYTSFSFSATAR
ncbi:GntR family transcriptional regulator [Atopobium sp. oral taxon 810]|uniref:GntR family transcriptional regulator n=1 Tax=Atopobium sp. oral taxon 810 TaxID=712158 RepID=UPI0003966853|nr:GntR family transcriptional regulator [Atopobium sp. oral taxon 810]ERI06584.1 UbiC transcription regulator-associated domain protein [Atopobium sp. oral taxon 810 str. F0209]